MPNFPFAGQIPTSLQEARNEFDRLLDRVWHVGLSTAPLDGQDWAPCIDVLEEADRYQIRAEIPGATAGDVEVSILNDTLTIQGNKPGPSREAGADRQVLRSECRYGRFCRRYQLAAPVRDDAISAVCKHGVLEITIPKTEAAKGRSVRVVPAE